MINNVATTAGAFPIVWCWHQVYNVAGDAFAVPSMFLCRFRGFRYSPTSARFSFGPNMVGTSRGTSLAMVFDVESGLLRCTFLLGPAFVTELAEAALFSDLDGPEVRWAGTVDGVFNPHYGLDLSIP